MPTLLEIAEREKIVLFDSSAIGLDGFLDLIFPAKRYADLSRDLLIKAKESIEKFLEFIRKENTFTVREARKDFENLNEKIGEKQKFLNKNPKIDPQYAEGEGKELLLEDISDDIFKMLRLAKSKIFRPEDNDIYNAYYEALPHLFDLIKLSQIPTEKHRQLYAAALYLLLYQRAPVALVVRSKPFWTGLKLLVENFLRKPIEYTQNYPIKLYNNNGEGAFNVKYPAQK